MWIDWTDLTWLNVWNFLDSYCLYSQYTELVPCYYSTYMHTFCHSYKHIKQIWNTNVITSSQHQNQLAISLLLFPHILCFLQSTIVEYNSNCSPNHCSGIHKWIVQDSKNLRVGNLKIELRNLGEGWIRFLILVFWFWIWPDR